MRYYRLHAHDLISYLLIAHYIHVICMVIIEKVIFDLFLTINN
jgi:hypothetical protein